MKKAVKVILIVLGSIIVCIVVGIVLLLLIGHMLPDVDEEQKEQKPTISIESNQPIEDVQRIGGVPDVSEEDLQYFDSIEEALKKTTGTFDEYEFLRKIEHMIKHFESDQYAVIFYTSIKDKKTEGFNAATFKVKKGKDKKKQYALMTIEPMKWKKNVWVILGPGGLKGDIEQGLRLSDFEYTFNVENVNARFIWGGSTFKEIYTLKIEGQKPTEIIPHKTFGKEEYFWYYEDLKSKKPSSQLEVTIDEPKRQGCAM